MPDFQPLSEGQLSDIDYRLTITDKPWSSDLRWRPDVIALLAEVRAARALRGAVENLVNALDYKAGHMENPVMLEREKVDSALAAYPPVGSGGKENG